MEVTSVIGNILLVAVTICYVKIVYKQLTKSDEYFRKNEIDFELAVQEQKRNQAESDVTQLRIKKAEFKASGESKGDVESIIHDRLKEYEKCRIPEIVNRINELKKEKEKLRDCSNRRSSSSYLKGELSEMCCLRQGWFKARPGVS